jgi:hypothetical protein
MSSFFSNQDYLSMTPESDSRFYYLVAACKVSRYTTPNSMGLIYAMGHKGLLVIGSTKEVGIGGGREVFHGLLGQGYSFGASHKEWLNSIVFDTTVPNFQQEYLLKACYGFVILGAGNLKLHKYNPITVVNPVPIQDGDVKVFPNPANNLLFINGLNQNANVAIYDMTGKLIYNSELCNSQIDVSNFQSGVYMMKIETANGIVTKKFVKQ